MGKFDGQDTEALMKHIKSLEMELTEAKRELAAKMAFYRLIDSEKVESVYHPKSIKPRKIKR